MDKSKVIGIVKEPCGKIIDGLGYDLVDVTFAQEFGVWELTFYIKSKSGAPITHKDCERVTKAIDDLVEELNPTDDEPYSLSVASVGVDTCDCDDCSSVCK